MAWLVEFSKEAEDDFSSLDKEIQRRIVAKLEWFEENFNNITPLALSADWAGFYKIRVGNYRIIYTILKEKEAIVVEAVDHRSGIYNKKKK